MTCCTCMCHLLYDISVHISISAHTRQCIYIRIRLWLLSNKLLINSSKTTVLNISTSSTTFPNITLNNIIISPSHSSKNLGLLFYYKISFKNHILSITKSYNLHLFRIKKKTDITLQNLNKL